MCTFAVRAVTTHNSINYTLDNRLHTNTTEKYGNSKKTHRLMT